MSTENAFRSLSPLGVGLERVGVEVVLTLDS
jgi:hypothetical protein